MIIYLVVECGDQLFDRHLPGQRHRRVFGTSVVLVRSRRRLESVEEPPRLIHVELGHGVAVVVAVAAAVVVVVVVVDFWRPWEG